jgi:hypothetical protein
LTRYEKARKIVDPALKLVSECIMILTIYVNIAKYADVNFNCI